MRWLENTNMAIGIQHYLIDVLTSLTYEALTLPFWTFIRPRCKEIGLLRGLDLPTSCINSFHHQQLFVHTASLPRKLFYVYFTLKQTNQTRPLALSSIPYILSIS